MEESPPKPWQQQLQRPLALPFTMSSSSGADSLSLAPTTQPVVAPAQPDGRSNTGVALYEQQALAGSEGSVFASGFGAGGYGGPLGGYYSGGSGYYGGPYGGYGGWSYAGYGGPSYLSSTMESLARVSALLHAQGFFLDHIYSHTSRLQQRVVSLRMCMRSLSGAAAAAATATRGRIAEYLRGVYVKAREGAAAAATTAVAVAVAAPDVLARQQQQLLQQLLSEVCLPEDECSTADTSSNGSQSTTEDEDELQQGGCDAEARSIREALVQLVKRIRRLSLLFLILLALNLMLFARRRRRSRGE
ncbi:glycine, alanine and asparagine-rich protein [Cyclospora cayetanensis]|uniref:Glycine, alanine and asparagine-rich protein n=1 Tax=Cyclospora cayetanensis TaxID=88456 RepID=A0A6P6RZ29_9EIME|nr:glycine, alanine and asparagine-rich protein [Cyclospora cayetanensis]